MANYTKGKGKSSAPKKSVEEIVAAKIVDKIMDTQQLPWQQGHKMGGFINWATQRKYSGINILLLYSGSGEYITMNQLKEYNEKNGTDFLVKKGSKSEIVVYKTMRESRITEEKAKEMIKNGAEAFLRKDENGNYSRVRWQMFYHNVFDIQNIENSKGEKLTPHSKISQGDFENVSIEQAVEKYCNTTGVEVKGPKGNTPCYIPSTDTVHLPLKQQFKTETAYYGTMLHELTHSTGVPSRLNRMSLANYTEQTMRERGREEFVAEIGRWLILSELGVEMDSEFDNSLNYVQGWCNWMKSNPAEILKGMTEAEKAKEYFLTGGTESKKVKKEVKKEKGKESKKEITLETKLRHLLKDSYEKERAAKVWTRIKKANADKYITDLGFVPNGGQSEIPYFKWKVNEHSTIVISMTFALIVNENKEYKELFNLDKGDTLQYAASFAAKYRIKPLFEFIKLLSLRTKIPTYTPNVETKQKVK